MKRQALTLIILMTLGITLIAFSKDFVITYSNGDSISIPLKANSNVEVLSANGNVIAQTDETGLELCERLKVNDASISCTASSGGTAPAITSFTVSPTSITSGGSATLTWVLANDATSCTKSTTSGSTGSWSGTLTGAQVTNGNHSQVISNITTNSTYRLQCTNSSGSSLLKTASVTIATSASCTSQPPPPSPVVEDTSIIANGTANPLTYNGLFSNLYAGGSSNTPWPGSNGASLRLTLNKDKYIAAQFNSGSGGNTGQITNIAVTNFEGPPAVGGLTWSISECPGDFKVHLGQAKCSSFGFMRWSTEGVDPSLRCQLSPNTTYYLNLIHVKQSDIANNVWTSTCTSSYCGQLSTTQF